MTGPVIDNTFEHTLRGWRDTGLAKLKAFGVRVFIHTASLITSIALALSDSAFSAPGYAGPGKTAAAFAAYTGLVCIFGRGKTRSPDWLVPAGAGLIQAAVLVLAASPLFAALFWGGAQSFASRLIFRRPAAGELPILLLLLPLAIMLVTAVSLPVLVVSFAAITGCGALIAWRLASRVQVSIREAARERAVEQAANETLAVYRRSVRELHGKLAHLAPAVRPTVAAIAASAENILACMAEDPRDLAAGQRFLKRYLTATHKVADNHLRLSREQGTREISEALAGSEEMLARLENAFAREYEYLRKNDIDDFSADLKVLDTLLKMDGR